MNEPAVEAVVVEGPVIEKKPKKTFVEPKMTPFKEPVERITSFEDELVHDFSKPDKGLKISNF